MCFFEREQGVGCLQIDMVGLDMSGQPVAVFQLQDIVIGGSPE